MALYDLVQQSTQQLLPQNLARPPLLNGAYKAFHWVHRNCHWIRRGHTYLNPQNFPALITGHAVNFAVGDNRCVRLAAQLVLISNRILECVEAQIAFSKAYSKWKDALRNNCPLATIHKWKEEPLASFISPSTSHRFYVFFFHSEHYCRQLSYRTAMLAKKIFFMSMATIEAVDAFSLNAESSGHAVNEFFVNGLKSIDVIAENRERMRSKLIKNKSAVECVLKIVKAPYAADQFINFIDATMGKVESANNVLKRVNGLAGNALKESAKYVGFGVMSAAGLATVAPDWLVPANGGSGNESSTSERFAPIYPQSMMKIWTKRAPPKKRSGISLQDAYAELGSGLTD